MIIWIFQSGEPLHSDTDSPRPMRAMNLANELTKRGHKVILWSSAFFHQSKIHRSKTYKEIRISDNLTIRLIPSSGYKTNISISRFYDHFLLAWNLRKNLKLENNGPDVAFIGFPPIEAAFVMSNWLKKRDIPFLLDVKDQWPNILVESFPKPLRFVARSLLSPYYFMAKKAMQNATGISTHTDGFLSWALKFSNKMQCKYDYIAPLTGPDDKIQPDIMSNALTWWADMGIVLSPKFRIIFVGSFSRAFNFEDIFSASLELSEQKIDCEFILCGDGDKDRELRLKAEQYDNIRIIGWIDRPKIKALSDTADATIAPYKSTEDFTISIPNKIIDSLMLGLPILSPLEGEVASIIEKHSVGYKYGEDISLTESIKTMISETSSNKHLSDNALDLYKSEFEYSKVYSGLVAHLENLRNL